MLAPSRAKNWKLIFTNFFLLVYLKNNWSVKFRHLFKIYHCYGNKNGQQNRLKTEKLAFWTKFKAFGDRFFLKLDISTANYQKILLICCVLWQFSSSVKISFWYLLVLYVNFSVKPITLLQNGQFLIFSLFWWPFLLHSNDKSQSNLRLLHFGYCSNKLTRTNW